MKHDFAYEHVRVEAGNGVLRAMLDRPASQNAMNRKLIDELLDLFSGLYWRHDIRIVVLTANGRTFCAGLDLKESSGIASDTGEALRDQRRIAEIVIAMRRCPQVIVAAVQGAASGGGFALALASDIRIATPTTRMNAAFIRIGLGGCDIGVSYFLPRMVGSSVAAEYLLTGRFITAERAYQLGLVSQIVEAGELDTCLGAFEHDLLATSPLGLRLTKEALNHAVDAAGLEAVVAMEDRNQILCAQSDDFPEGVAAFREKRPPNWKSINP